jgi:hypothetical protein
MLAHIVVISINFNSQNGNIYWQNTDGSPWRLCSGLWQVTALTLCVIVVYIVPFLLSCDSKDITETL